MDIPPGRPFYILVSNFSNRQVRLQKHMIIAECACPPDVIADFELDEQQAPPIGTPEIEIDLSHLATQLRDDISAVH